MSCNAVPTAEEALTVRLLQSTIDALELFGIYLGKELGLYGVLKSGRRVSAPELAYTAGIDARYAREWLAQQAVAGLLSVERASVPADERRYWLPAAHAHVLASEDHPAHLGPLSYTRASVTPFIGKIRFGSQGTS